MSSDEAAAPPPDGPLTMDEAYAALELDASCKGDLAVVKSAYRRLCLRWHPDKNPAAEEAACRAKFTRVTAAYHTITTSNFDYARWARSYAIPPMQTLEDVLQMALGGRDPFEIEAVLRARGDYRPDARFGVDVHVPWSAGTRHDPTAFDDHAGAGYRTTREIAGRGVPSDAASALTTVAPPPAFDIGMSSDRIAGASSDRPWERVGGVGFGSDPAKNAAAKNVDSSDVSELLRPDLDASSDASTVDAAADALNDAGLKAFAASECRRAMAIYDECLRLRPDVVAYLGNRAAVGLKLGTRSALLGAAKDCERATTLDPAYARGFLRMGKALAKLGDDGERGDVETLKRAVAAFERCAELDPGNEAAAAGAKDAAMSLQIYED